jgi:hypothetical protein
MLVYTLMLRRSLLVASLLAIPATASAGGYVAAGIGTSPDVNGNASAMLDTDGHNSGRLALGQKFGPVAIEGGLSGFGTGDATAVTASVGLKLQTSISSMLGLYARGSLDRTWIRSETMDVGGDGHTLGVGLDYGVKALADGGVWLEVDRQYLDLDGVTGTADTITIGLRIGL